MRLILQVFKGKDGPLTLDWDRVRVFDRDVGQMFVNLAKTSREARVRGHTNTLSTCTCGPCMSVCYMWPLYVSLLHVAPVCQSVTCGPCRSVCYILSCYVWPLQVESVSKKEKAKQRPLALNTVEMLRVASSSLGKICDVGAVICGL